MAPMAVDRNGPLRSGRSILTGRVLTSLAILFLALDAGGKLFAPAVMIANGPPLGLPADPGLYRLLGAILAACLVLFAWPRTSLIGAVLLTRYLCGAVAIHIRSGSPLLSHTFFPPLRRGDRLDLLVAAGGEAARFSRHDEQR